ncbi:hypothetical protein JNB_01630 [Janibacter sp. HTCC2649]|nr:hypothetical protein JNB_01630 [Janibacter sp. HTCC2649]
MVAVDQFRVAAEESNAAQSVRRSLTRSLTGSVDLTA